MGKTEFVEDVKQVDETVGVVTNKSYNNHGSFSNRMFEYYFGSLQEARKELGLTDVAEYIAERCRELGTGRYSYRDIFDYDASRKVEDVIETVNERENGVLLSRSSKGGASQVNYYITVKDESVEDRYEEYFDMVDDRFHHLLMWAFANGRSVKSAAGFVLWKTRDDLLQDEAADMVDITPPTIRNFRDAVNESDYSLPQELR